MKTKIFGHRGAKGYYPENSMLSFERALEMGADGLELDVHYSKDGEIVVFHDFEMDRMTLHKGMIFEKTWEELSQTTLIDQTKEEMSQEKIPKLEEVLRLLKEKQEATGRTLYLNVEFKAGSSLYKGIEGRVAALCLQYLPKEQLIFSSFDHFALKTIKEIDPNLQTGVLTTAAMVEPWEYVEKLKGNFYHPYYLTLTPEVLMSYKQAELEINPYTVNDLNIAKQLIDAGIYGIISDIPDQILKLQEA